MPIPGESYAFTKKNVDAAPDQAGVYVLKKDGITIYIGMSKVSIRNRLQSHLRGDEGGTKAADTYKREVTTAQRAPLYEAELLAAYKRKHGKLPRFNEVAS